MGGKAPIPVALVENATHPVITQTFERLAQAPTGIANIHRMIANSPEVFGHFIAYAHSLRHTSDLDPAERELAIIRVLTIAGGEYELMHHHRMGAAAGLTAEELAGACADTLDSTLYAPRKYYTLLFASAFARGSELSPEVADRIIEYFDDRQRVELALTLGLYLGLARVTSLLVLPID